MQLYQTFNTARWDEHFAQAIQMQAINALENGELLFFPKLAFSLANNEQRFLSASYVDPKTKNISFDPRNNTLRGILGSPEDCEQIKNLLTRFAQHARLLIDTLFPHYAPALEQARASLRPVDISHRKTSYRKDDKRLHIDAFPASPNQGRRILRVFTNINPNHIDRVWRIGEPFPAVAQRFLPQIRRPLIGSARLLQLLKITKSRRTEYDHIMLQIHDRMKANITYQRQAKQTELRFSPGSSWIVLTDQVSHAAMSGQHMLEQTFYLPASAMLDESRSPLKILESLTGRALI